MAEGVYILGGYQTDFAKHWARDGWSLYDGFAHTVQAGLAATKLDAHEIDVGHVGNFVADAFAGQAQLGGFFGHVDPALRYLPASRHEAACASGSMALFAAMADIAAGYYQTACVVGIELMRNVPGAEAAAHLRPAAWADKEWTHTPLVWPAAFSDLIECYQSRYALDHAHLYAIAEKNYHNGRVNPLAQTRQWAFTADSFSDSDEANPEIYGNIRRQDCGQITDGAAVIFLANAERAADYAKRRGLSLNDIPRIKGWGHVNAPLLFEEKLSLAEPDGYLFPHIKNLFDQTLARAGLDSVRELDGLEVHDCFSITEYMILDHAGLFAPGEVFRGIDSGLFRMGGELPVNASGGLIGAGHPVGATGVRMALDAFRQVTDSAGENQIAGAENLMTFNLGGTATTCASVIVGKDQ